MELGLTETQELLRNSARNFFENECPLGRVREIQASQEGFSRREWEQAAALGWPGLLVAETYQGSGGNLMDAVILLEEVGRALAPLPLASTAVVGALALQEFGTEAQRATLLPRIAVGESIIALAVTEPSASYHADGIRTRARLVGDRYILDGTKLFVRDGTIADLLLVATRTEDSENPEHGITLFLVDAHARGVGVTPLITSARDRQAEIQFSEVAVPHDAVVGTVGGGWPVIRKLIDLAALSECAEMVGAGQRVFETTLDYAKTRVQFGRPIGSFQSLQHKVADMAIDIDSSRFITYYAAWKADTSADARADIARTKVWVSDAFRRITREAHQVHGGVGFIVDHDLHLFFGREKTAELYMGTPSYHRMAVAEAILGPAG
ncbi:MAG: acyl-CoA dehydrogenase family protein [Dehalococcoidia bacterium]